MENQYNYYTSEDENTQSHYGMNDWDEEPEKEPGKKKTKGSAKWVKVVCTGLVFGVVASAAFQASNIVGSKITGTTTTKTAKTTTTASNAKLTTSSSSSTTTGNVTEITKTSRR